MPDPFDEAQEGSLYPSTAGAGEVVEIGEAQETQCDFPDEEFEEDPEARDWANDYGSDAMVDADALASAGLGTDEDYGCYGDDF